MGQGQPDYNYAKPMDAPAKKGESRIYRHPFSIKGLITTPSKDIKTLQDVMVKSRAEYANLQSVGVRPKKEDGELGGYVFKTYEQTYQKARCFGSGLINLKLTPEVNEYKDFKLKMLGIYAVNQIN
jgi:long-chain acyl-CoA synthetase